MENRYLRPLFWQHGEKKEILVEEIEQMYQNGVGEFIVESRPHPDYLGYGWWRDLDIIIEAAKQRDMGVWIFDDSSYPSGVAAGKIAKLYPEMTKRYMGEYHIDVMGPRKEATINIGAWVKKNTVVGVENLADTDESKLLYVLLAKRNNGTESLDETSICDITPLIQDGKIVMDIPEGSWRIFIIVETRNGGEEWTKNYANPLSKEAMGKFIEIIYEEHYKHYSQEFGKTIKGFFCDEPRFGNAVGYEDTMWKKGVVYPYSHELMDALDQRFGKEFKTYLPYLWSNEDAVCKDVHYCYMDTVTKLFAQNFTGQIGDWCRAHQVKFIGHVVEDNGVHARLGYGAGHFFRAMEGMDSGGLDVVYHVWPDHTEGRFTSPFGYLDNRFFYWGISKMASSATHIDSKKDGETICEIFGAYGWQLGLKMMKWLTDHVCVRGINLLIPHAFSPKYPDYDCPPHFYAGGHNPQWPYFSRWSSYANRVCDRLSHGIHRATAAVLYHAEAEWGGTYEPFEQVVQELAQNQLDCDVVPADYLVDETKSKVAGEKLWINQESYQVLIIPYAQSVSQKLAQTLLDLSEKGLPIVFMSGYPEHIYFQQESQWIRKLKESKAVLLSYGSLAEWMRGKGYFDVKLDSYEPQIRVYHYDKENQPSYFITNEDVHHERKFVITLPKGNDWMAYDAMEDRFYELEQKKGEADSYYLTLASYQSVFLYPKAKECVDSWKPLVMLPEGEILQLNGSWQIQAEKKEASLKLKDVHTLKNISSPDLLPEYSGGLDYRISFEITDEQMKKNAYLSLGEVYETCELKINGTYLGCKIVPPYLFDLSGLLQRENQLEVHVVNTFVKEKGDNRFDRAMVQEPSGLLGEVKVVFVG